MKPRRTPTTDVVYRHPQGNEDNDLWCQRVEAGLVRSVWVPDDDERKAISEGGNVELWIYNEPIPPVAMTVTKEQPGRAAA